MMLSEEKVFEKISLIFKNFAPQAVIEAIKQITPDASLRRYFRIFLKNEKKTLVAMHFDSLASPEASGRNSITSDLAFVELAEFLGNNKIAVPKIIFNALDQGILILEDLGDVQLFSLIKKSVPERIEKLFKKAIDQILLLQKIPPQKDFFPYQRSFTAEQYYREMLELVDFSLQNLNPKKEDIKKLDNFYKELALCLEKMPKFLVHRDFHAWNLLVQKDNIRVIDFQDALMATQSYDLVSLLNDRDMDSLLGENLYKKLVHYFFENINVNKKNFFADYDLVLLQRDLKVSGRFYKLANARGLSAYKQWIPGTLKRLGSTLERISSYKKENSFSEILEILSLYYSELKSGAEKKLRFN